MFSQDLPHSSSSVVAISFTLLAIARKFGTNFSMRFFVSAKGAAVTSHLKRLPSQVLGPAVAQVSFPRATHRTNIKFQGEIEEKRST